jgi:hypothetical protein
MKKTLKRMNPTGAVHGLIHRYTLVVKWEFVSISIIGKTDKTLIIIIHRNDYVLITCDGPSRIKRFCCELKGDCRAPP